MPMSAKTFSEDLNKLVSKSISEGCPLDAMILELTLCEHQVYDRYAHLVRLEMVKAQAAHDAGIAKVVIESGKGGIPSNQ